MPGDRFYNIFLLLYYYRQFRGLLQIKTKNQETKYFFYCLVILLFFSH